MRGLQFFVFLLSKELPDHERVHFLVLVVSPNKEVPENEKGALFCTSSEQKGAGA